MSKVRNPELFGWRRDNPSAAVAVFYKLSGVATPLQTQIDAMEKIQNALAQIGEWAIKRLDLPTTAHVAGRDAPVTARAMYMNRSLIGDPFGGTPEGSVRVDAQLAYFGTTEDRPVNLWPESELPSELREFVALIDEHSWSAMRIDIERRLGAEDLVPSSPPGRIFISYRAGVVGRAAADRLDNFLRTKGLPTWLFPYEVGWADNRYEAMESALTHARAAVVIFTPDFMDGATASHEYYSLLARRSEEKTFKAGMLLVGTEFREVPPMMKQYFHARSTSPGSADFDVAATVIYRGILGLPLENRDRGTAG